jgi:hypothetical protein
MTAKLSAKPILMPMYSRVWIRLPPGMPSVGVP